MFLLLARATALAEEEKCAYQEDGGDEEHEECDEEVDHGVADRGLVVVAADNVDEVGRHNERRIRMSGPVGGYARTQLIMM